MNNSQTASHSQDIQGRPYALKAGEGWTYRFGIDFTVKCSEISPGRGAAFMEYTTVKGEEPPPHAHPSEDEMIYVLEGALTFYCESQSFEVAAGGFVFLPAGSEHGYTIRSEGLVRLLVVTAAVRTGLSGGWGGYVADLELGQGELVGEPPGVGR